MSLLSILKYILLFLFLTPSSLYSQELSSIERKLTKEPTYRGKPEYALLVLGPRQEKKLWLVRDGDVLYIDRAGTGDLTQPSAKVIANAKASSPSEFEFTFEIGKLPGCPGEPSDFTISTRRLTSLPELNESMKQAVARDANAVVYSLYLQTQHPQLKGNGVNGRLVHMIGPIDHQGALQFGKSSSDAPIIHVGGPLQILPYGDLPSVRAGNSCEIDTAIGTPGLGKGTTAYLGYEKTIPPEATASLEVTYPKGEKQTTPLQVKSILKERCCGINLYGKLQVPDEVGAGKAQVTLSLSSWKEGAVAPSESTLEILAKSNKVIPQTVSLSPNKQFAHQDRQGSLYQLQFSPDASKLFAASYPGGVLQFWDVVSGQQTRSIETGKGLRGSAHYSMLSPDWKDVWVGEYKRGQYEEIEKEGKKHIKSTYESRLRGWKSETGTALEPIIPHDGRNFRHTVLSPDGRYILALEEVSGTFLREAGRPQKLSLYDLQTKKKLPFSEKYTYFTEFTKDSKHLFVMENSSDPSQELIAWHLISVPDGKIVNSLTAEQKFSGYIAHHSVDLKHVFTQVTNYAVPKNYQKYTQEMQCWNLQAGKLEHSIPMGDDTVRKMYEFSEDERWLITCTIPMPRKPNDIPSVFEIYSLPEMKLQGKVTLPGQGNYTSCAFHPQRPIVVKICQTFPKEAYTNRDFDFHEDEAEQPKLVWIDLNTAKILRTDTLPPSFPGTMKFSPDGKTLAISVKGGVHLYEVPTELLK